MIGPLAKFVRTSNSFKIVLRYFGKVRRKSNVCIIRFDWLIALYLFTLLPRNESFLIIKSSGVREELSDVNKPLCKNIFLVSLRLCTSPLVRAPPQLTLFTSATTTSTSPACARHVRGRQFPTLEIHGDFAPWKSMFLGRAVPETCLYTILYSKI